MPVLPDIETSQLIWFANQLTGFHMRATLTFNGLNIRNTLIRVFLMKFKVYFSQSSDVPEFRVINLVTYFLLD